jgi:O-antigen ligase
MAVQLISQRPWFGWGAQSFGAIYKERAGYFINHPHTIGLDLAQSHGWPVAVALVGLVLWLLLRTALDGMAGDRLFERAWWAATLVLVALHATDIPMYDSRLNIAGWVLLVGLRCRLSPGPDRGAAAGS